jgi:hypothetical protein
MFHQVRGLSQKVPPLLTDVQVVALHKARDQGYEVHGWIYMS